MKALVHGRAAWDGGRTACCAVLALLAALAGCSGSSEQPPKGTNATSTGGGKRPEQRVLDLGGGVKMSFVLIPAGTFTMGSTEAEIKAVLAKWPEAEETWHIAVALPNWREAREEWFRDEKPAHKVSISRAFWMGKHEVTVGQFRRFVEATGYKTDAEKGPEFKQTDEHPVVCVSWNDAHAFVDWLNATDKAKPAGSSYRLPTEAEWEYACRAGTSTWYQWGDDPDKGKGWCNAADLTTKRKLPKLTVFNWDDGFLYTAPVGSFKANALGLHDMHGNVSEWCQDWYGDYKEGHQTDPTGPASGEHRVLRGGSWQYYPCPGAVRSAYRTGLLPELRLVIAGFRLVLSAGP
ncbi:MAG TPA: formylglycine-generating enzyme family protein [Planctomycetota bacterium]|nr:formylglycine-generating enzyme family protein [Planctomycetota bacterium]